MSTKKQKNIFAGLQRRKQAALSKQGTGRLIMPKILDGDEGLDVPDMPEKIEEILETKQLIDQSGRRVRVHVVHDYVSGVCRTEYRGIVIIAQQVGQQRQERDITFAILTKEEEGKDCIFNSEDLIEAYKLFSEKAKEFKEKTAKEIRQQSHSPKIYTA